jgi:hypothetical protein
MGAMLQVRVFLVHRFCNRPDSTLHGTHYIPVVFVVACHAVPGVDLANHSATPTAYVEVRHSPAAVQGLAALEDVADPATLQLEPSTLRLLAGPQGIK